MRDKRPVFRRRVGGQCGFQDAAVFFLRGKSMFCRAALEFQGKGSGDVADEKLRHACNASSPSPNFKVPSCKVPEDRNDSLFSSRSPRMRLCLAADFPTWKRI